MPTPPLSREEQEFLSTYDPSRYPRPSVTADIVIFTMINGALYVLLIKRGGHPYKDCWALPGGFLEAGKESVDDAAARELYEETGVRDVYLKQLYTFSQPDRDPRTHVVSVAYTALVPRCKFEYQAGDDARDARLFRVEYSHKGLFLIGDEISLNENYLAFDHAEILKTAITRLRGRVSYEPDAFELLNDKNAFTVYELKQAFEAVMGQELNTANFRRMFTRNYLKTGFAEPVGESVPSKRGPAAPLYKISNQERS